MPRRSFLTTNNLLPPVCLLLAILAGVAAFPVIACEFRIKGVEFSGTQDISYDVFDTGDTRKTVIVEIERIDDIVVAEPVASAAMPALQTSDVTGECTARIRVQPSSVAALTKAGARLEYLLAGTGNSGVSSTSQGLEGLVRNIPPGGTDLWEFIIAVESGQIVGSGMYTDFLRVFAGADANDGISDDEELVRLQSTVGSSARIAFAGVQGRNRIVDFGAIENGSTPVFQPALLVQSTAGYRLRFRSDNKGKLLREGRGVASAISYRLEVEGELVDLAGTNTEVLFNNDVNLLKRRIPLEFSIPDADSRRAGVYRDRVIVDIVPMIR